MSNLADLLLEAVGTEVHTIPGDTYRDPNAKSRTVIAFPINKFEVAGNSLSATLQSLYLDSPPDRFRVKQEDGNVIDFSLTQNDGGLARYTSNFKGVTAFLSAVGPDPFDRR